MANPENRDGVAILVETPKITGKSVRLNITLADDLVERIDLSRVKREDFEVLDFLKSDHPDLYKKLRRAVKANPGAASAAATPASGT